MKKVFNRFKGKLSNPWSTELVNLNFQSLEVLSRYRDQQLQVSEYYSYFVKRKVIYHPLYGMNNYVLIWGDWLSCDPLRGSHDSQSPPTLVPHLVATLIYLSQNYSYYIRDDSSHFKSHRMSIPLTSRHFSRQ